MTLRHLALAASPGVLALALAAIALLDADGDPVAGPAAGAGGRRAVLGRALLRRTL